VVDEIAPLSVEAAPPFIEIVAVLGLVLHVDLLVGQKFSGAVGKLAAVLVGTVPEVHELPAELGFLFVLFRVEVGAAVARVFGKGAGGRRQLVGFIDAGTATLILLEL
jgi:hypothetical protein